MTAKTPHRYNNEQQSQTGDQTVIHRNKKKSNLGTVDNKNNKKHQKSRKTEVKKSGEDDATTEGGVNRVSSSLESIRRLASNIRPTKRDKYSFPGEAEEEEGEDVFDEVAMNAIKNVIKQRAKRKGLNTDQAIDNDNDEDDDEDLSNKGSNLRHLSLNKPNQDKVAVDWRKKQENAVIVDLPRLELDATSMVSNDSLSYVSAVGDKIICGRNLAQIIEDIINPFGFIEEKMEEEDDIMVQHETKITETGVLHPTYRDEVVFGKNTTTHDVKEGSEIKIITTTSPHDRNPKTKNKKEQLQLTVNKQTKSDTARGQLKKNERDKSQEKGNVQSQQKKTEQPQENKYKQPQKKKTKHLPEQGNNQLPEQGNKQLSEKKNKLSPKKDDEKLLEKKKKHSRKKKNKQLQEEENKQSQGEENKQSSEKKKKKLSPEKDDEKLSEKKNKQSRKKKNKQSQEEGDKKVPEKKKKKKQSTEKDDEKSPEKKNKQSREKEKELPQESRKEIPKKQKQELIHNDVLQPQHQVRAMEYAKEEFMEQDHLHKRGTAINKYDDFDVNSGIFSSCTLSTAFTCNQMLEVDYNLNPTQLFLSIEDKNWAKAMSRAKSNKQEACIWVYRREPHNNDNHTLSSQNDDVALLWRILPIHAAAAFGAPRDVFDALIAAFPQAVTMEDDCGMLPIHIACQAATDPGVVIALLSAFPNSCEIPDQNGRLPIDIAKRNRDLSNLSTQKSTDVIMVLRLFRGVMKVVNNRLMPENFAGVIVEESMEAMFQEESFDQEIPLYDDDDDDIDDDDIDDDDDVCSFSSSGMISNSTDMLVKHEPISPTSPTTTKTEKKKTSLWKGLFKPRSKKKSSK